MSKVTVLKLSVAVIPFYIVWKYLGTWNMLTDELHTPVIGNVVMGVHCENTQVINEFQNPIYVDGLKDVVVAACPDGIYLAYRNVRKKWTMPIPNWGIISQQLEIKFGDRYSLL